MPEPKEKIFKPAPPKFAKELAENGSDDPEPEFLRQYILGDRAIEHRRSGELGLAATIGVAVGGCVAATGYLIPLWAVIVLCAVVAIVTAARSFYLLWDAKMADVESRALVAKSESNIRILSDEEVAAREAKIGKPNGQPSPLA